MSEARTVRTLGVAAPGRPAYFSYTEQPPEHGQFRVDTVYTGLSAGTELTFVRGTNPYLHASWDAERGVFLDGEPGQRYPVESLGYMEVGRVVETRTPEVATGDLVASTYGHRSGHVIDARRTLITVLPPDLDPLLGIYVAQMGPICAKACCTPPPSSPGSSRRTRVPSRWPTASATSVSWSPAAASSAS